MNYKINLKDGFRKESYRMYKIDNKFVKMLQTRVRDKKTSPEDLQTVLYKLGEYVSTEIIANEFVEDETIVTPLEEKYEGLVIMKSKIIIISTKDDYRYFASGIYDSLDNCERGYMDFGDMRGSETLSSQIRSISLPDINKGETIDTVIIAKSVLATGCTAISLLRKTIEKFMPKNIIIASVFYSKQGIKDLKKEIKNCKIYVCGEPDALNNDGMLIPGIGNIDERIKIRVLK